MITLRLPFQPGGNDRSRRIPAPGRPRRPIPKWMLAAALVTAVLATPALRLPAADILIDSSLLSIIGDDNDPDALLGAFYIVEVVDGIAQFRVYDDFVLGAGDSLVGRGSRPISLIVAGNVTILDNAVIDMSALNVATPGPGGGEGGAARSGGAAGAGGRRGIIGDRSSGNEGGAGGGAGSGGSAPSGNGTGGGDGKTSLAGINGAAGRAGTNGIAGVDGVHALGSGGAGGMSGGDFGSGGAGGSGSSQSAGGGGSAGAGGFLSGGSGGSGDNATAGGVDNGRQGTPGTVGESGIGGLNTGASAMISGGGGGGSGKSGGGGGGGGGGRNGAGGGGGGGGGAAFTVSGTNGGGGGRGGRGGAGGQGGDGGAGGAGGSGGGAFEIIALGRLTIGGASLLAKGGDGSPGQPGLSGVDPGSNGEAGVGGGNVTNGAGRGGDGGDGTAGGRGAVGQAGGPGGSGGGGAGGTIKLVGSHLVTASSMSINVSGGRGGTIGLNDGQGGRFLVGNNSSTPLLGNTVGATPISFPGPRATNPHIVHAPVQTPYIPELLDGVAIAGILKGLNAGSFPSVVANAPNHARIALLRLTTGPSGYAVDFPGFHWLLFINLTCEELPAPALGVGEENQSAPLQRTGPLNDPLFGGSSAEPMASLEPYCIYAILIPEDVEWFTTSYAPSGSPVLTSRQTLNPSEVLYLAFGVVDCPGPIPPPTHGDENTMVLANPTINADGRFQFFVIGAEHSTLHLQKSSDLIAWESAGTITLFDKQGTYVAPSPSNSNPVFYRAVKP